MFHPPPPSPPKKKKLKEMSSEAWADYVCDANQTSSGTQTSEARQMCWPHTFCFVKKRKKKKTILQIFSRLGKKMNKLQ